MNFNATEFLARLKTGEFDGRLHEELNALPYEQLEELALLMAEDLAQGKLAKERK